MGALSSLATLGLNAALATQADRRRTRQITSDRDRQLADIRARDADARRERDEALRRLLARERARAGAAGVLDVGGSADAILRGLTEESALAQQARDRQSAQRMAEITRGARDARRRSLLDTTDGVLRAGLGGRSTPLRSLLDL